MSNFIKDAADYWSADNAQFEGTNPDLWARAQRSINPMTGFGSAMGAMQDAAGQGSIRDMGIALLQALPLFGVSKLAHLPLVAKDAIGLSMPTLKHLAYGTAASVAADQAQARSK